MIFNLVKVINMTNMSEGMLNTCWWAIKNLETYIFILPFELKDKDRNKTKTKSTIKPLGYKI